MGYGFRANDARRRIGASVVGYTLVVELVDGRTTRHIHDNTSLRGTRSKDSRSLESPTATQ